MRWQTPDFKEINLSGEMTAYANTDGEVRAAERRGVRPQPIPAAADKTAEAARRA